MALGVRSRHQPNPLSPKRKRTVRLMPNPGSPASGPVAGPGWWCRPSGPAVCFARPAVARGAWGTSPFCLLRYVCCLPRSPSFTAGHRTGVTRIASGVWPVRARIAPNYAPDSAKSIRVLRIIRSLLPGCATKRTHLRQCRAGGITAAGMLAAEDLRPCAPETRSRPAQRSSGRHRPVRQRQSAGLPCRRTAPPGPPAAQAPFQLTPCSLHRTCPEPTA